MGLPPGLDLVGVSVYAQINRGLAYPTAQAIVEDLEPLLHPPAAERLLVGGDFDAWDQFTATAVDRRAQEIWQALWRRLEDFGLVNLLQGTRASRTRLAWCACGLDEGCWHVPTVRRMRVGRPAHCDYIFASRWFADRLVDVDVVDIDDPELADASDHAPVTATFSRRVGTRARQATTAVAPARDATPRRPRYVSDFDDLATFVGWHMQRDSQRTTLSWP